MKLLKILPFILLFLSCNKSDITLKSINIKNIKAINTLDDGTYIADIRNIKNHNNLVYLTDYKRNQIIILNNNLKLKNTFGGSGRGPGEFLGAQDILIDNANIYITNDGIKSIEVFNDNGFSHTISPPKKIKFNTRLSFFKLKEDFFMCSPNNEFSLVKFDSIGNIFRFGSLTKFNNKKEEIIKNKCHLVNYQNKVISISNIRPEINVYDLKGTFLYKYDYSNLDIIKNFIEFTKTKKLNYNSFFVLVSDVSLNGNKLYLKISTSKNNKGQSNKLLELEILENSINPKQIINLGNGWFNNFSVKNNIFYGFNTKSGKLIKSKILYDEI